jgi:hypothetical protein
MCGNIGKAGGGAGCGGALDAGGGATKALINAVLSGSAFAEGTRCGVMDSLKADANRAEKISIVPHEHRFSPPPYPRWIVPGLSDA